MNENYKEILLHYKYFFIISSYEKETTRADWSPEQQRTERDVKRVCLVNIF